MNLMQEICYSYPNMTRKQRAVADYILSHRQEIPHMSLKTLAERAAKKNIKEVVFDRGGYVYQGRVQELAEGAREGGLDF